MSKTPITHGTINGYCNRKCRCGECREAWRLYFRAYTARQTPPPPGDPRHGRLVTYTVYRCRCDDCRAANTAHQRACRERAR